MDFLIYDIQFTPTLFLITYCWEYSIIILYSDLLSNVFPNNLFLVDIGEKVY